MTLYIILLISERNRQQDETSRLRDIASLADSSDSDTASEIM